MKRYVESAVRDRHEYRHELAESIFNGVVLRTVRSPNDDEVVAEYLTAALEDENPDVFLAAVGNVAKARGMSTIAERSGLGRESLYKALASASDDRRKIALWDFFYSLVRRHIRTPCMNSTLGLLVGCAALVLLVAGCEDRKSGSVQVVAASSSSATSAPAPDKWLGKWNGPEGTFLQLTGSNGKYEVTIENLDGPRIFQGQAVGNQVEFERNGVKESLRATNGAETGMKWLSERSNCLTVRPGEGYCRD